MTFYKKKIISINVYNFLRENEHKYFKVASRVHSNSLNQN